MLSLETGNYIGDCPNGWGLKRENGSCSRIVKFLTSVLKPLE